MISSRLGCFGIILFIIPAFVIGLLVLPNHHIYIFREDSPSWPLHSLMILGAMLVFLVGRFANRKPIEEITYEKSGPVIVFLPRHTLFWIRMEYWGPILLVIYFAVSAFRYYR